MSVNVNFWGVFRRLYMEKTCRRVTLRPIPQLPWSNQRFLNFLTKLGEPVTWETKRSRVTLLARLTFFHINFMASPAGSSLSRWDNQSMRERCCQLLTRAKGQTFLFSYKSSPKLTGLVVITFRTITLITLSVIHTINWRRSFHQTTTTRAIT